MSNMKTIELINPAISDNCNVNSVLRHLRLNHPQQIIIGHLNINSIRNKFDLMKTMLTRDILMITETKLDDFFPVSQFEIDGFSIPFRLDRHKNGGDILLYIHSYIVAYKLNNYISTNDIEAFFIEINIKGNKWHICCSYNPNRIFISRQKASREGENELEKTSRGVEKQTCLVLKL